MDEYDMSDELFHRFVTFLHDKTGIALKDYKKYLVVNRLLRYVGPDKAYRTFEDYYEALSPGQDETLTTQFVNALTTNFSYFFRDPVHFRVMSSYLRERGPRQDYVRLWSAASSTGEEAYSMAITLAKHSEGLPEDRRILATDISTKVLQSAERGVFLPDHVRKATDQADIDHYFTHNAEDDTYQIKAFVRQPVAFRYLNLLDDYPIQKPMDIIFLRNVMIYFGERERTLVVNKMFQYLKPGGLLFIGLSESLGPMKHPFITYKSSVFMKPKAVGNG